MYPYMDKKLSSLVEFCLVLGIGGVISTLSFYSLIETGISKQFVIVASWVIFFIIPLIYYRLIKVKVTTRWLNI